MEKFTERELEIIQNIIVSSDLFTKMVTTPEEDHTKYQKEIYKIFNKIIVQRKIILIKK